MLFKRLPNEIALQRKYIGHGNSIRRFRKAILYAEQQVLTEQEYVLASIAVSVCPQFHRHMHGLLVATNHRLLFITASVHYGAFFDVYPYYTIERLTVRHSRKTTLTLRFRRMDKTYIVSFIDERLSLFRQVVRTQVKLHNDESHIS